MAINRKIYDIEKIQQRQKMNLSDCYLEEDLFPKIFTDYEERDYSMFTGKLGTKHIPVPGTFD